VALKGAKPQSKLEPFTGMDGMDRIKPETEPIVRFEGFIL
jgi:hypothetical protein